MNEITIYNSLKGRHETVRFEFTPENTTWFDSQKVYRMADAFDGLLIQESGYSYPILIGDVSRSDIGDNEQKALELLRFGCRFEPASRPVMGGGSGRLSAPYAPSHHDKRSLSVGKELF